MSILRELLRPSLPPCPSAEEVKSAIPRIGPVVRLGERPFWSVMIPVYNCAGYLRRALESVLQQDPGADRMQIEVIDDCSTKDDPEGVVREIGKGRVSFFRNSSNQGPTGTFNTCIQRSIGEWVHILHGDDMVLPGFYREYEGEIEADPRAGLIYSQSVLIDEDDRWTGVIGGCPPSDGRLVDFVERQAVVNMLQCPSAVVRRSCYEAIGGFCARFPHAADWNMWFRVGQMSTVRVVRRPFSLYRVHSNSDTSRLVLQADNIRDSVDVIQHHLSKLHGKAWAYDWKAGLAESSYTMAVGLGLRGLASGRYNQAIWAWKLFPSVRTLVLLLRSYIGMRLREGRESTR